MTQTLLIMNHESLERFFKMSTTWAVDHLTAGLETLPLIHRVDANRLCVYTYPLKHSKLFFTLMAQDHSGPANETFMCSLRGTVAVPVQKLLRKIKEVLHFLCWLCPQFSCSTTSVMLSPWKHPGGSADSDACVRVMTFNQLHTLTFPVTSLQCCWETQQEIDFRNTPIAL